MRRHKAWLYQVIRRYIADRDDAYDILQESFVATWGALARYDPERPFGRSEPVGTWTVLLESGAELVLRADLRWLLP